MSNLPGSLLETVWDVESTTWPRQIRGEVTAEGAQPVTDNQFREQE